MATKQVNGSDVTGSYRFGGSTKNNNGVAVNAGSPTGRVSKVGLGRSHVTTGSVVVDRETTNKAVSAGVFAYSTQKPISARLSVVVGASSSNVLLGLANVPGQIRSIHKIESRRVVRKATAMRAGNFNLITGKFTVDPTSATDSFGSDVAASPTRAVPGKLVYKLGSYVPVSTGYKAKTGG
jgi:hypothetical protein